MENIIGGKSCVSLPARAGGPVADWVQPEAKLWYVCEMCEDIWHYAMDVIFIVIPTTYVSLRKIEIQVAHQLQYVQKSVQVQNR